MAALSRQVKMALESADLGAYGDLLDPNVRWGPPGSAPPPCQNRDQVLAWYRRGKNAGTTATVSEVTVEGDHLLVGLVVRGLKDSLHERDQSLRWQLLTVRDGRVCDIVGFESRENALAYNALSS
ncbi:MAG: nuclear transport factor 2 family protein [Acidimicrobiales bacterium]